jgi:hypothetical protein
MSHLVLCGGAEAQQAEEEKRLDLNLHGSSANDGLSRCPRFVHI